MRKVMLVLFVATGIGVFPADALAGCFEDAAACFERAAGRDSFIDRTLAGLDCELDLIECGRRKILGR